MSKADLRVDWATQEAAKYACENWHYSGCLPVGKLVKVGAWESGRFIGVVVFARGANRSIVNPYGLSQNQGCELARVALTRHRTPVSRIMAIAVTFLKRKFPGLRLVVSYADPEQNHHGGVYQACNWIYRGVSGSSVKIWNGNRWVHQRSIDSSGRSKVGLPKRETSGKHCYLMPLDDAMRDQVTPLAKPYPKRPEQEARRSSLDVDVRHLRGRFSARESHEGRSCSSAT